MKRKKLQCTVSLSNLPHFRPSLWEKYSRQQDTVCGLRKRNSKDFIRQKPTSVHLNIFCVHSLSPKLVNSDFDGFIIWHIILVHLSIISLLCNVGLHFCIPHSQMYNSLLRRHYSILSNCNTAQQRQQQLQSDVMKFFDCLFLKLL
jgi:hypothetical protein